MKNFFAVFALALVTISAHAQPNKNAAQARRIFDAMRAEYSQLETFSHGNILFVHDGKKIVSDEKVAFRQPNRYSMIVQKPEGNSIAVSTGHKLYGYAPNLSKTKYSA